MNNTTELTPQEVNLGIAELIYIDDTVYQIEGNAFIRASNKTLLSCGASGFIDDFEVDYCNNWNDLMPLVIEHEISLEYDAGDWNAYHHAENPYEIYLTHKDPQLALALTVYKVLLAKSKESENEYV